MGVVVGGMVVVPKGQAQAGFELAQAIGLDDKI